MQDITIPGAKLQAIIDSPWYKSTAQNLGGLCEHSVGTKPIKTKPIEGKHLENGNQQEHLMLALIYLKKKLEVKTDQFWGGLTLEGTVKEEEHWHYNSITKELELYEEKSK